MSEFKEFWLHLKRPFEAGHVKGFHKPIPNSIHVIEYKAYEELRRETDKLVQALENIKSQQLGIGNDRAMSFFAIKALTEFHKKYPKEEK